MKRLLAYLFIVLGLGLTFSVNVKAQAYCASADFVKISKFWSYCKNDTMYAPHFKRDATLIKLNKNIYFLMKDVERRAVKEIKRKEKRTGKIMIIFFMIYFTNIDLKFMRKININ